MALTETARKLLATFDALPDAERQEVYRAVLQRAVLSEHESLTDADLVAAADDIFLNLDLAERNE